MKRQLNRTVGTHQGSSLHPSNILPAKLPFDLLNQDAVAYFQERGPFTPSQAVSIARALRPVAKQVARHCQAHGATAPGRSINERPNYSGFDSRKFIARCVGFAPGTLRKAQCVLEAAEANPDWRDYVIWMDAKRKAGEAFTAVLRGTVGTLSQAADRRPPAGREFGERMVKRFLKARRKNQ